MAIISVIKNDGPGNILIWQCMEEDFNNNSLLVVSENEEALFVKDGIVVQTFPAGKYTLNTANYPFIGTIRKKFTGGVSPFSCKVYFINKAHALELYWGTNPAMQLEDPLFGIITVGALGSYSIQIKDSKKFLLKLVGNNVPFYTVEQINNYFRTVFTGKIKTNLAKYIRENNKSILDLMSEYDQIAEMLIPSLEEALDEYGVRLVNFYISGINIPEDDPSYARIKDAVSRKKRLDIYGEEYGRLTGEMMLENMTTSENNVASLGVGVAAGGTMAGIASQVFAPTEQNSIPKEQQFNKGDVIFCSNCGCKHPRTAKFCSECGTKLHQ